MTGPQRVIQKQLDIKQTTEVLCDECKNKSFTEALLFRRVSALMTDTGKEGFMPIQVFACVKCGHVNNAFIPEELRPIASKLVT
jgi:hypothetical protein